MRASSFMLILLMTVSLGYAGCGQSGEKDGATTADSGAGQASDPSIAQEAEEKIHEVESGIVDKTKELHEEQLSRLDKKSPEEVAKELWTLINTEGYKINWKKQKTEVTSGEPPVAYLNDIAYEAVQSKAATLPPGSIIVEEQFGQPGEVKAISAIINLGGGSPEGDWFYAQYSPDGKILKSGEKGKEPAAP